MAVTSRAVRLPPHAWVGVDLIHPSAPAAAAWRVPGGLRGVDLPPGSWRELRRDGRRCAVALPMGRVFTERIEPPAAGRRRAARLVRGMLDLRLPVPVESCEVTVVPERRSRPPAFLAFAVPREALVAALAANAAAGCPAERLVPAALPLWRRLTRLAPPPAGALQLLLHAEAGGWTLLAGRGAELWSCLTLAAGDVTGAGRAAQVYMQRWQPEAARLHLCGPAADEPLAAALSALPLPAPLVIVLDKAPGLFLARALAEEAALAGGGAAGNLRCGEFAHPALRRRLARRERLAAAALVAASLLLLGVHATLLRDASRRLREIDEELTRQAAVLAGRSLPARGAAVVELARRELETRLNPQVEAFGEPHILGHLPRLLRLAALRGISFSRLEAEERRLTVAGRAPGEADVAAWREAACRDGLAVALAIVGEDAGGVSFSGTLILREGLP